MPTKVSKDGVTFHTIDDAPDSINAALAKGYKPFIDVSKENGKVYTIEGSEDSITSAIGKGYKVVGDIKKPEIKNHDINLESVNDFLGSVTEGVPFSEVAGKLGSLGAAGLSQVYTSNPDLKDKTLEDQYNYFQNKAAQESRSRHERSPIASMAGNVVGGFAGPTGANVVTRVGSNVIDAASRGENSKDAIDNAETAGMISAGIESLPYVGKAIGKLGKNASKTIFNVTPENIDYYKANKEAVNSSKTIPELKDAIDSDVYKINAAKESAKYGEDVASNEARDAASYAKDARRNAENTAKQSERDLKETLKNVKPPHYLADDLINDINAKSGELSELSGKAFDTLSEQGHTFKAGKLKAAITSRMNELKIGGVAPQIGGTGQAYKELGKFRSYVDAIGKNSGGEIPASDVKSLIKLLDESTQKAYDTSAGALAPKAQQELAQVRRGFNKVLRDSSDAYKSVMDELAPKTGLISEMSDVFGDKASAINAFNSMSNQKGSRGILSKELLSKYDEMHGTNFLEKLDRYFVAQDALANPSKFDRFKNQLPEVQSLKNQLPEELSDIEKQAARNVAKNHHASQKANAEMVSMLGPRSTENVVKSTSRGRSIEAQKQLDHLSEITGIDYSKAISDSANKASFAADRTNGARRTVFGTAIGGTVGSAIGGPVGTAVGSAIGGYVGAAIDKNGGKMVKWFLDNADPVINKYAPIMENAAKRGTMSMTHALLMKNDSAYREKIQTIENSANQ